jgi:Bacterial extracellular solute-binding proteins, family 3
MLVKYSWYEIPNGTQNELIANVVNGKADFGILPITEERNKIVDFTMPYSFSHLSFYMRSDSCTNQFGIIQLFLTQLWLYVFITIVFSCLTVKYLEMRFRNATKSQDDSLDSSVIWLTMSGILIKSVSINSLKKDHKKIISIVWHIFGILFWTNYTTFVLEFALKECNQIDSIDELAESVYEHRNKIFYGIDPDGFNSLVRNFKASPSRSLNIIGDAMKYNPLITPIESIEIFKKPNLVYIDDRVRISIKAKIIGKQYFWIPNKNYD